MNNYIKILAGLILFIVVAFFIYWFENKAGHIEVVTGEVSVTKTLKDGEYLADMDYMTPAGKESIGVKILLSEGKITSVFVENRGVDKTSKKFQERFIGGIQSIALNQPIENLSVGVMSGASLTSGAFNQALAKVKAEALQ